MLDRVSKLINHELGDVLSSPVLSKELLLLYSVLFLAGAQPSFCAQCQKKYYQKLKTQGIMKAKEYESIKKRTCKPAWHGLMYINKMARHYNSELITDEQAIELLNKKLLKESNFEKLPENYKKEAKKTESVQEVKQVEQTKEIKKVVKKVRKITKK